MNTPLFLCHRERLVPSSSTDLFRTVTHGSTITSTTRILEVVHFYTLKGVPRIDGPTSTPLSFTNPRGSTYCSFFSPYSQKSNKYQY